jgi:hypothetical protein
MEEAWMRDRALLGDLLREYPQASPQQLARSIGRSGSPGEEVAQAAHAIRDPRDPSVLCSRSRAHHAPYFRWDVHVIQRIVELRLSAPENLKRVPGSRALLYYLPRDPELQAARFPLPRRGRTSWKILHLTGCLVTRSKELPHPNELREPLEEIQMDAQGCRLRLARTESARQAPACGRSLQCGSMLALLLLSGPRPERISPRRCVDSCGAWESGPRCAPHSNLKRMPLSNGITAPRDRSAYKCLIPAHSKRYER